MGLLLWMGAALAAQSLDVDRVHSLTEPDEQGRRIYTTRWSLLLASKTLGQWSVNVSALPWVPTIDAERPSCTVTLPVSEAGAADLTVRCTDDSLTAITEEAAAQWRISQIKPARAEGALTARVKFEVAEEDPTVMRGVVAPIKLRRDLANAPHPEGEEADPPSGEVVATRRAPPRVEPDFFTTLGSPIYTFMHFEIEKRKPVQLTLIEAHSMLWDSYIKAGFGWRFRLPKGADRGTYLLRLTLKQR